MEYLRNLLAGPDQASGALYGVSGRDSGMTQPRAGSGGASFAAEMFEEGARAGGPHSALAHEVAALDRAPRAGMGDHLALTLDRRDSVPEDEIPDSDLSFGDLIDVINPLQHIPVVGNLYRGLTGDTISGPARVAGATLYGGPLGMLAGVVNAIVAEVNDGDPGDTLVAGLMGESPAGDIAVASANPAPSQDTAHGGAPIPELSQASVPSPATAASFAGQAPAPVLTGDAALSALFGDFRRRGAAAMAKPEAAHIDTVVQATQAASPPAEAALGAGATPAGGFNAQMMQGLEKYRAMALERGGAGRPAPSPPDRNL